MPNTPSRILLVDDHPVVREGLRRLLESESEFVVTGSVDNAADALSCLGDKDVEAVMVDLTLAGTSGFELIRQIRTDFAEVRIVVLSMHDERFYAERALRAGANCYVMKSEPSNVLLEALRKVLSGHVFLSEALTEERERGAPSGSTERTEIEALSDRELEVLHLIGQGVTTGKIAEALFLSVKTIESYRANIKRKLNLQDGAELSRYAFEWAAASAQPSQER
ncbi:response regulator transcription factor [soil metagenome]